jgi:acetyl-CoA carboxylase carboxyltransferase component
MGGEQAAKTLLQIETASLKARGEEITPEKEEKFLSEMTRKYAAQTTAVYAAARLWVDAVIDPLMTRRLISENLSAADHNPHMAEFKTGVFQV